MSLSRYPILARSALRRSRVLQICLIVLFSWLGQALAQVSGLPVPGGVIGMAIVLVLLATRRLRVRNVHRGASWLLGEMLLFFVPAVMSLLDHREFLGLLGLKLLAVILLGTALVMAGTALTIDLCYRWMNRHAG
ncbi:CidA/LrgA family protein [Achromobacter denitrificans]|jgi:holin-like protein|uniref:CidA/LrgA family protein n=1 Tax=Achromobacter denitrificans TaxID=32002 RepID=A0A427WPR5_ACHDE|nr:MULTISPECIES: CidA/LrgA family protein [Achromobacter]ASC64005.1 CidA/LrgA family protein [Achromobacter denitrificans]MBV2158232.1 CidA/LrgA family protein [Achromobacter denitrificans]MDF3938645.1 CidA/LrgA family protein [Achromobacter denitrificans]MDX3878610.1 CidA/LrgA family protein [Achromobacter sp.]MPT38130.1 CidA/LrgA family protein [Achromobacter sp.]